MCYCVLADDLFFTNDRLLKIVYGGIVHKYLGLIINRLSTTRIHGGMQQGWDDGIELSIPSCGTPLKYIYVF